MAYKVTRSSTSQPAKENQGQCIASTPASLPHLALEGLATPSPDPDFGYNPDGVLIGKARIHQRLEPASASELG
jgi:hypothetical protein